MNGLRVKELIAKKGLSITEVAKKLEMSNQNLFNILSRDDVRTGLVERISEVTGISLAELYGIEPQQSSSALNTGTNHGNIAGRDITLSSQIAELQSVIAQQQRTISELSATIAKLVK